MSNSINKKLSELLGKVDDKVLQAKINAALDMLRNNNKDELMKKLGKLDKDEIMAKLNEFDENRLKELNINKSEMRQKLNSIDMDAVQKMLGEKGPEIISKIRDIIN